MANCAGQTVNLRDLALWVRPEFPTNDMAPACDGSEAGTWRPSGRRYGNTSFVDPTDLRPLFERIIGAHQSESRYGSGCFAGFRRNCWAPVGRPGRKGRGDSHFL